MYHLVVAEWTAFILAGGNSSRMGRDKATLSLQGRTLLERVRELASTVTQQVRVVGSRERYGSAAVEDVYEARGPLGGIHAALLATKTELNLVLSVDTPFVAPEFLQYLAGEAER